MVMVRHIDQKTKMKNKKVNTVVAQFAEQMALKLSRWANEKIVDWDNPESTNLLVLRKQLLAYVKEGMYGRKDLEIDIGAIAALIWFNRLEAERRERILDEWN